MLGVLDAFGFKADDPTVQAGLLGFLGVLLTGVAAITTWMLNRTANQVSMEMRIRRETVAREELRSGR